LFIITTFISYFISENIKSALHHLEYCSIFSYLLLVCCRFGVDIYDFICIKNFCLISFGDLVNSLEIGVLVQLLLVLAQFILALVMGLSIRETRKDRRREFLELSLKPR